MTIRDLSLFGGWTPATRRSWRIAIVLFVAACNPLRGCVEVEFSITDDSRLPAWFSLPASYTRSDVTVRLTYYTRGPDDAVFELLTKQGAEIAEVSGQFCWHPVMEQKKNKNGGFDPGSEPHYAYVTVRGRTEIIEHPGGSFFRISDVDQRNFRDACSGLLRRGTRLHDDSYRICSVKASSSLRRFV